MQLIGMLDSPYVRRVAVSLQLLGLPFTHRSLSVFHTFDDFSRVNPVVKAPTLVCDDGTVLMDSSLMLDYAEALAANQCSGRSLMPAAPTERAQALRVIGLALAACEKSVQLVYERELRPADKRHGPWVQRVTGQLGAALGALEAELVRHPPRADALDQASLSAAVAWHFTQQMTPDEAPAAACPALVAWSALAEALPAFRAAPHGDGTHPVPH
jgi:glutathione S-transferase